MIRYEHVLNYVVSTPWAILPEKLAQITAALAVRVGGEHLSAEEIEAVVAARPQRSNPGAGAAVAVIPVWGTIGHRAGMLGESSGGTSIEGLTQRFRQAIDDPQVSSVVLDVDSPGGTVTGVPELADEIRRGASKKPVVAVANSLAASAAYWLASQASELTVIPSGDVGSIGVYAAHEDVSKKLDRLGVSTTFISAGAKKLEGSPYGPLSEEARAHIQESVDHYYGQFTRAVARGRGVPVNDARGERFGEGRVYRAQLAVQRGLADRVASLDQVIGELASGQWQAPQRARAEGAAWLPVSDGTTFDIATLEHVPQRPPDEDGEPVAFTEDTPPGASVDVRRRRLRLLVP